MLSQADLIQVRNYVIRILPEILRQEPEGDSNFMAYNDA
jgi:hypothetical protein